MTIHYTLESKFQEHKTQTSITLVDRINIQHPMQGAERVLGNPQWLVQVCEPVRIALKVHSNLVHYVQQRMNLQLPITIDG